MSVYVTDFETWEVVHDDAPGGSHTGTIDPATIVHTTDMNGEPLHQYLVVECPVCQAVSTHPVGGGAQPPLVQELFVIHAEAGGCPCSAPLDGLSGTTMRNAGNVRSPEYMQHVKAHCEEMDGEGRWQLG